MKVIIRDMATGLYLNGPAVWGDAQSEALEFKNSIAALEFCVTQRIHNVELLLICSDAHVDIPLRLFPRSPSEAELAPLRRPREALAVESRTY